ncbi:MAG: flagellar protein FlgN [Planctomycetes bacterium]|nr:flagellar protein FlgN [Planctomycetota bacterium]
MNKSQTTLQVVASGAALSETAEGLEQRLSRLQTLLRRLLELAEEKLTALARADTEVLQRCAAAEAEVLDEAFRLEQERDAIVARLAHGLQWPKGRAVHVTELAGRLGEPLASRIRARSMGLREVAGALREKNRLTASVAQNLQSHVRGIFSELAKVNQETVVYGPHGDHKHTNKRSWVDAVG